MLPPGQTAAIITMTASILQAGISEKMGDFCSAMSVVVGGMIISLTHNWLLTLATSMGLFFISIAYVATNSGLAGKTSEIQQSNLSAASVATDAFTSMRMLAACGAESKIFRRYADIVDKTKRSETEMVWLVAIQQGLGQCNYQCLRIELN